MSEVENEQPRTLEEVEAELAKVKTKLERRPKDLALLKKQSMQSKILLTKAQGDLKKEQERTKKFLDAYNNMRHKFIF